MTDEEEIYPIDKKFRVKNREQEEKFDRLQETLDDHEDTRKYSDQASMELMLNLAVQRLEEIEEEKEQLSRAMP